MNEEDEYYSNSMEIGGEIHKQSDKIKKFNQIPLDIKYSFLDRYDNILYRIRSSAYQNYEYVIKNLNISDKEIRLNISNKEEIFNCKDEKQLKHFFINNNLSSTWKYIKELDKIERAEMIELILNQLNRARLDGFKDEVYKDKSNFNAAFNKYKDVFNIDPIKDDIGLLNDMCTVIETSKGFKGQFYKAMNTTININRDINPEDEAEEEPEQSESSNFRNKLFKKRN